MSTSKQHAIDELANQWRDCGIQQGDVLLLHSNVKRVLIHYRRRDAQWTVGDILESLLVALGSQGTLVLPLFNFNFTKGIPFDMRSSPSHMGILTEVGRQWPGAVRTGHPIYSFAAIGAAAGAFQGVCNYSGYGMDSPFALLKKLSGKIAVIDLPEQDSMTFYHHVEEALQVPYRYNKTWSGQYTDLSGNTQTREFSLFVRNIEQGVLTAVEPMGEKLWTEGKYSGFRPGIQAGMRVIDADLLYRETSAAISGGLALGLLYNIES
jgi:aminoglycoside 3-N-acetyltransferase